MKATLVSTATVNLGLLLVVTSCLTLADEIRTDPDQTVYTNLTETDWNSYFFGNLTEKGEGGGEEDGGGGGGGEKDVNRVGRNRKGKDFFDLIGLGTGPETDPYLARANELCISGDLSECFKSRALATLDDFFTKQGYYLTDNVRILRMPEDHLRQLLEERYEYSSAPRIEETEWEQFVKFLMRKVEKFVKSTALEVKVPEEVTEGGRYSPRFVDDIASELDVIEDKKAGKLTRRKLKKLFIPLLIILKLFKLKLLLFLPLILGIASFKKLLGFLAIVIPGLIGVFKLCKPQLYSTSFGNGHAAYYQPPKYTSAGVGHGGHEYYSHGVPYNPGSYGYGSDHYGAEYHEYAGYRNNEKPGTGSQSGSGSVAFRDDSDHAHASAYSAYRNSNTR